MEGKHGEWSCIDTDVANDPCSAANAAVPAGFAGSLAAEGFIGKAGHNRCRKPVQKALKL